MQQFKLSSVWGQKLAFINYRLDQNQGHHRGHQVQECRHHLGRRVQDHQLVPELRLCGWLRAGWTAGIMGEFCLGGIPQISQVFHRLCPENITDENTCNATTDIWKNNSTRYSKIEVRLHFCDYGQRHMWSEFAKGKDPESDLFVCFPTDGHLSLRWAKHTFTQIFVPMLKIQAVRTQKRFAGCSLLSVEAFVIGKILSVCFLYSAVLERDSERYSPEEGSCNHLRGAQPQPSAHSTVLNILFTLHTLPQNFTYTLFHKNFTHSFLQSYTLFHKTI